MKEGKIFCLHNMKKLCKLYGEGLQLYGKIIFGCIAYEISDLCKRSNNCFKLALLADCYKSRNTAKFDYSTRLFGVTCTEV